MYQILETQLTTSTLLAAGSSIPVGTVVHKKGNSMAAAGNAITIRGTGYFRILASLTVEPTAVADMTVNMYENGSVIATATETPAVAGDATNLTLIGVIYNPCGCANDQITLTVNSAGTVTNMTILAERM